MIDWGIPMINRYFGFKSLTIFALMFLEFAISQKGSSQPQLNADMIDKISWQRKFDDNDRLTKLIDPAGRETTYIYSKDSSGKTLVTRTNAEGNIVTLEFDDDDLLNSMTDGSGTVIYQYDDFGRLIHVQRDGKPAIQYKYDNDDRITNQNVGDFYTINYTYDFLGRLSTINTPAGAINYKYQTGQGQVRRELPNGVKTIWEFSVNGQLLKATHLDPNNYLLAEFQYQYRPDGLIDAIAEKTQKIETIKHYAYDKVGRLIEVTDKSGIENRYEYDLVGNRIQATSSAGENQVNKYDWAGRLTNLNGRECSHDAAGNLNPIVFGDSKMNYQYNQDCRLIKVNDKVLYKYDGDGKLIERQVDGELTGFISDPLSDYWRPLVMENSKERTLLIWDRNAPLIIIKNGKPEYILADHLGSARLVVDEQGKVKHNIDYDPFGTIKNGIDENGLTPGFSGLFYDPQAKLYLTRARAYDPTSGQFLQIEPQQRIPSGSQKELTLYAYCGNDPVNFIDLNGAWPYWAWGPENMAWQVWHNDMFDRNISNKFYDDLANQHTGWRGAALGVFSGLTPGGDPYSDQQKQAKVFWNLADTWPNPISIARNIVDVGLNIKESLQQGKLSEGLIQNVADYAFDKYVANIKTVLKSNLDKYITSGVLKQTNYTYYKGIKTIDNLKNIRSLSDGISDLEPQITPERQFSLENKSTKLGRQSLNPSTVGGVYLGGAGQALDGIGQIEGLSLDANNNLVLISKKGEQINMPPLRVDDIVTVFRSVYTFGEGPTVTIDPNPDDPENSAMIIRHGKATESTYVGWILYQADRLMKSYMLGVDNITSQDLTSKVPGYNDVLNSIYFGDGVLNTSKHEGKWERFWIVPAKVNQFSTKSNDLTLFDVPLKVKTQVMKWENGALVDDSLGKSSLGATKFTAWFTKEYDSIAKEQYLMPPSEFGFKDSVPVFTELRRIAVITALAEKMRDQGVAMPFWMRDYEVRQVQFEKYTPGMQITRTRGNTRAKIFGGVSLSPESKEVKQFTSTTDLKQLNEDERVNGEKKLKLVNTLSVAVTEHNSQNKPMQNNTFEIENESYQTIQIPGSETKALSPCRIEEVD